MSRLTGVEAVARDLARRGAGRRAALFRGGWWDDRLLGWAMRDPAFKTQLFRFVDVLPACTDAADVERHVEEYFGGPGPAPRALRAAVAASGPLPAALTATVAHRAVRRLAAQFILGEEAAEVAARVGELWSSGTATTVDLLGEKVLTDDEADRYAERVGGLLDALLAAAPGWPGRPVLEHDHHGALPRANLSVKPTAFSPRYAPLTRDEGLDDARRRLLPLLSRAAAAGVFVWFDMEHYDVKGLTLELFRSLLDEPALADLDAGVVVQAYLRDTPRDLVDLLGWAEGRPRPVGVRLVKGAYWDAERIEARAQGWPVPVWEDKAATDACYEACAGLLLDAADRVRPAFASHNLRSVAVAVDGARRRGLPDAAVEVQMLHGMAEPMQQAIRDAGLRLRLYAPVGELVPGMAYLVRRLLENTSNESFVRQRFAEGRDLEALLAPPPPLDLAEAAAAATATDAHPTAGATAGDGRGGDAPTDLSSPYRHEPVAEWRRPAPRRAMARALDDLEVGGAVPAVIGGERVTTSRTIVSTDPAHPDRVVAVSASCGPAEAAEAVRTAAGALEGWRRTPAAERAAVVLRAAAWMRARRWSIAALEVAEAGKPWAEADADVCEAVDFCEYYAREMLRLDRGGAVESPPGETNSLRYQAKGVGVVIGPWNFPLAIPAGMVMASLVAGNTVVLKPAEQTPAMAGVLVRALEAAGLPPGVLGFLPGPGEEVGAALVDAPEVAFVVFTGSRAVGLDIVRRAATTPAGQRHVKRVVAEMGGKNALLVDSDADLDQAVPVAVRSAFGFSGQKCSAASRVIVHEAVHDEFLRRFVGAARALRVGDPRHMGTDLGPVIDQESRDRIESVLTTGLGGGRIVSQPAATPAEGWYLGPTIVAGADPRSPVVCDELFGPVVHVGPAPSIEAAVEEANRTDYALTAGIVSRSPASIRLAAAELRAGNVYVNRATTGAVVGRQPFGGYGLSGVGSKAGGPDYLLQLLDPRVVTENTLRQGFAPE